jgi:hypothetical protein
MQGVTPMTSRGSRISTASGLSSLTVESLPQAIQGLVLPVVDLAHTHLKLRDQFIGRLLTLESFVYRLLFICTLV